MTCNIDHDAENAIPMFLCVACNREMNITEGNRQTLEMANAICAAVDRVRLGTGSPRSIDNAKLKYTARQPLFDFADWTLSSRSCPARTDLQAAESP